MTFEETVCIPPTTESFTLCVSNVGGTEVVQFGHKRYLH